MKQTGILVISLCLSASLGRAGMITSGDVTPADPADWDAYTLPVIGTFAAGSVTIDADSDVVSFYGSLGFLSGSSGVATVTDVGSTWTNTNGLCVAYYGDGAVDVTNGGALISDWDTHLGYFSGSTGVVTVKGAGSTWSNSKDLYVGFQGSGTVNIVDGGSLSSDRYCYIGRDPDSNGNMIVSGAGATWVNSEGLSVGYSGNGSLDIIDAAVTTTGRTRIGELPGSTGAVNVSGAGATWNSKSLYLGYNGDGALSITSGAVVSSSGVSIGYFPGSTGAVIVSGAGSTWTNSSITVDIGSGTLDIVNGGAVITRSDSDISGYGSRSVVKVSGSGSTWTNSGDLMLGSGGNELRISDGGLVDVGGDTLVSPYGSAPDDMINLDDGVLNTSGLLSAVGDLTGLGTINCRGLVSDVDLVFDSRQSLKQVLRLNGPGQDITVNLDVDGSGLMGAGVGGRGSMRISGGVVVESTSGYVGYGSGSTGTVTVVGTGSMWGNSRSLEVGGRGNGALDITDGGAVSVDGWCYIGCGSGSVGALNISNGASVSSEYGYIGDWYDSSGVVSVSGDGSTWTNSRGLYVGRSGNGVLVITNGGTVSVDRGFAGVFGSSIGEWYSSSGMVTVSGTGSAFVSSSPFFVGERGQGTLRIYDGGMVKASDRLTIDDDGDGDSFITMATGGMLALKGFAHNSLGQFLGLIYGTDDIRYWDDSVGDWAHITGATAGEDYTLEYLTRGDLAGHTVLTVTAVPEPGILSLFAWGGLAVLGRPGRRRLVLSGPECGAGSRKEFAGIPDDSATRGGRQ